MMKFIDWEKNEKGGVNLMYGSNENNVYVIDAGNLEESKEFLVKLNDVFVSAFLALEKGEEGEAA
jgi:hypothetical protein|tara:strand:+ start:82 stop:276 length:195 start_codon:yes stop_codon:yes gene_type:complete